MNVQHETILQIKIFNLTNPQFFFANSTLIVIKLLRLKFVIIFY